MFKKEFNYQVFLQKKYTAAIYLFESHIQVNELSSFFITVWQGNRNQVNISKFFLHLINTCI